MSQGYKSSKRSKRRSRNARIKEIDRYKRIRVHKEIDRISKLKKTKPTKDKKNTKYARPKEVTVVNRNFKDTMFRKLFQEKESLLQLYNAVNNTHYKEAEQLEIVTLENAIYMNMKNDLAFLIDFQLHLYEHQSSVNPNMPLRFLQWQSRTTRAARNLFIQCLRGSRYRTQLRIKSTCTKY